MRRLRRARATGATGLVACLLVAGCTVNGGSATPSPSVSVEPSDPESTATSPSTSPEPVTLTLAVHGQPGVVKAYRDVARAFTRENPHVTVEVEASETADDALVSLERSTLAEDPPDVFLLDHEHLPLAVERGYMQPVDALMEARQLDFGDGFQRDGLAAFAEAARLQCMPHDVSPYVVYINEDLVMLRRLTPAAALPPNAEDGWTWEQFAQAARQASRGKAKGLHLEADLTYLAPFVWSAGADVVDDPAEPTTLTMSEPDTRAALEQVLTVARDPQLTPTRGELAQAGPVTRFKRGQLGMLVGGRELTPSLRQAEDLDFEVMPLPSLGRYRTIADMNGYCISAGTEHLEAAADLVAFAVGEKGARITARSGYVVPANLSVAHSTAFVQPGQQPANEFVFNEGVRRADMLPAVPSWPRLDDAIDPLVNRLMFQPVVDLDLLLAEIDATSQGVLAPELATEQP